MTTIDAVTSETTADTPTALPALLLVGGNSVTPFLAPEAKERNPGRQRIGVAGDERRGSEKKVSS
jgi:hypothetical protein